MRLWVRIPPGSWLSVCWECCVLLDRGLRDELITHPKESYWMWRVVVCDLGTLRMWRPWPALGRSASGKKKVVSVPFRTLKATGLLWRVLRSTEVPMFGRHCWLCLQCRRLTEAADSFATLEVTSTRISTLWALFRRVLYCYESSSIILKKESTLKNFIELNRLCTTQLRVVFYNWLHQQHVSALLGHHQAYEDLYQLRYIMLLYRWDPMVYIVSVSYINTN